MVVRDPVSEPITKRVPPIAVAITETIKAGTIGLADLEAQIGMLARA